MCSPELLDESAEDRANDRRADRNHDDGENESGECTHHRAPRVVPHVLMPEEDLAIFQTMVISHYRTPIPGNIAY